MAGNNIRCVAKYLYDNGYVNSEEVTVETRSGVHRMKLYIRDGFVSSVSVDMGRAELRADKLPANADEDILIDYPIQVHGKTYRATCVGIGNPHCVVFSKNIDRLDLENLGPKFEYHEMFPERINTEFVRVVNRSTLRMRVWERGNGETLACGTGACAAAIAAVENGFCDKGRDITVKVLGGDLVVNYSDEKVTLTGSAVRVFEGEFEY